jgi:hypothetical protein
MSLHDKKRDREFAKKLKAQRKQQRKKQKRLEKAVCSDNEMSVWKKSATE